MERQARTTAAGGKLLQFSCSLAQLYYEHRRYIWPKLKNFQLDKSSKITKRYDFSFFGRGALSHTLYNIIVLLL